MPCFIDPHGDLPLSEQKRRRSGVGSGRGKWEEVMGGEKGGEISVKM